MTNTRAGRLTVSMTEYCNVSCSQCWVDRPVYYENFDWVEENSFIKMINSGKYTDIFITGGEPLLFQDRLKRIVTIAKSSPRNCKITLFTNGTVAIPEELRKDILNVTITLQPGLQGRQFNLIKNNVKHLVKLGKNNIKFVTDFNYWQGTLVKTSLGREIKKWVAKGGSDPQVILRHRKELNHYDKKESDETRVALFQGTLPKV